MSLVRLLMYSNEIDLEGLIATTSTWQKEKIPSAAIHEVIAGGTAPVYVAARENDAVTLDATASSDPDKNGLTFEWFHYSEAGFVPGQDLSDVEIAQPRAAKTTLKITRACRADWLNTKRPCGAGTGHVILAVTDDGSPRLTS